jgi:hypothetical protein
VHGLFCNYVVKPVYILFLARSFLAGQQFLRRHERLPYLEVSVRANHWPWDELSVRTNRWRDDVNHFFGKSHKKQTKCDISHAQVK